MPFVIKSALRYDLDRNGLIFNYSYQGFASEILVHIRKLLVAFRVYIFKDFVILFCDVFN